MLQSPYPTLVILLTIHRICLIIFWHSQSAMLALNQNSLIKDIQRYSNRDVSSKSTYPFDNPGCDLRSSPSYINPKRDHVQPSEKSLPHPKEPENAPSIFPPSAEHQSRHYDEEMEGRAREGRERALYISLPLLLIHSYVMQASERASREAGGQSTG